MLFEMGWPEVIFQAERKASAKVLGWECAWSQKAVMEVEGLGGETGAAGRVVLVTVRSLDFARSTWETLEISEHSSDTDPITRKSLMAFLPEYPQTQPLLPFHCQRPTTPPPSRLDHRGSRLCSPFSSLLLLCNPPRHGPSHPSPPSKLPGASQNHLLSKHKNL